MELFGISFGNGPSARGLAALAVGPYGAAIRHAALKFYGTIGATTFVCRPGTADPIVTIVL